MLVSGKITKIELLKELKSTFKNVKFYCNSDYNSVRIKWTNGPTADDVEKICRKYEAGTFDGMDDMYHYDNVDSSLPQCKYIFTERTISDELMNNIKKEICDRWQNDKMFDISDKDFCKEYGRYKDQFIHNYMRNNNI